METEFQRNGIDFLKSLPKNDLILFYRKLKDSYYNDGKPLLTDDEFDIVEQFVENLFQTSFIGAPSKTKVQLPYFMGSLQKIKADVKKLNKWKQKYSGDCILSTKLDGVSALWDVKNSRLYTRGDGEFGQDISHLLSFLMLPVVADTNYVIRGELIMKKRNENASCIRNIVTGIIQSKIFPKEYIGELELVPFEIIEPSLPPKEQFEQLHALFSSNIEYECVSQDNLSVDLLSQRLETLRISCPYPVDGVVVSHDQVYPIQKGNPPHAFAFKLLLTDQLAEIIVTSIAWNISKDGYFKPIISFEPVRIGGSEIRNVNGQNANFICKNNIGIGARLLISKSGDVIPYIEKVVQPATICSCPSLPHRWNDSKMEYMTEDKNLIQRARCTYFMNNFKVDGLGTRFVDLFYEHGIDSIDKFLNLKKETITNIPGIGTKTTEKIYNSFQKKKKSIPFSKILALSGIVGRGIGEKKLEEIFDLWPDWYKKGPIPLEIQSRNEKKHVEAFLKHYKDIVSFYSRMVHE